MINRRQFTAGLAGSSVMTAFFAAPGTAAIPEVSRRAEIQDLRRFCEQTHPRGIEAAADKEWNERWARLASDANGLSDGAYFIAARRALGWFKDGHTTVLPFDYAGEVPTQMRSGPFGLSLPLVARIFDDGVFVTATGPSNRQMLGSRIVRVGKLSSEELIRRHATGWPGSPAWAHRWAGLPFVTPALLQGFGAVTDPKAPASFTVGGGDTVELAPTAAAFERVQPDRNLTARENWAREAGGGNYVRRLPQIRAVYVSIDEMGDLESRSFEQLTRDAFTAMASPDAERLIVDLRRNGGGNNYLGEALRKAIQASRFNRPGGLYVLTSPRTFSAAQNLANRLERETFALFVGEPTGSGPNHYGDSKMFTGTATGMSAIVSTIPWFDSYPQDEREWIMPDLFVPDRFEDWRSGRDAAFEAALDHRGTAPPDYLSRDRIFYFRRPSQAQTWSPFWLGGAGKVG